MYLMLQIMMAYKLILWNGHVLNNIHINFRSFTKLTGKILHIRQNANAGYLCVYKVTEGCRSRLGELSR